METIAVAVAVASMIAWLDKDRRYEGSGPNYVSENIHMLIRGFSIFFHSFFSKLVLEL